MAEVSFFDPQKEMESKRRRQFASALSQQSQQPNRTEVVSGIAVKQSPLLGLAKALSQGYAGYQDQQSDAIDQDVSNRRNQLMSQALSKVSSNPDEAISLLSQDPNNYDMSMKIGLNQLKNKQDIDLNNIRHQQDIDLYGIKNKYDMNQLQFKADHPSLMTERLPAAIQLANEIQRSIQSGDIDRANLLAQSAKMYDKGINPYGQSGPGEMNGYGSAAAGIQYQISQGKQSGKLKADKIDKLEESDAELSQFDSALGRFENSLNETKYLGPVSGRYGRATKDENRTNFDSSLNELSLRSKTLLGMPSANFSDADREFLEDISGGKFSKRGGYEKVVARLRTMANDQKSINQQRRSRMMGGSPPPPNNTDNLRQKAQQYIDSGYDPAPIIQKYEQMTGNKW